MRFWGEVIDAYTSWEWSTRCDEIAKLDVDLPLASLVVSPLAKRETPETAPVSDQVFASDFATGDQSQVISNAYRWRRWESKTSDFAPIQATTGNHRKPDPELAETKDEKKHVRETALPTGKIERETTQGRGDVEETPTAETLGTLARKVLSSSRHADSRRLARAVLRLLALNEA
jgi:hypothetical protein